MSWFNKNTEPLPAKKNDAMPHTKLGMSYKEWMGLNSDRHKWRNIRWGVLIFINFLFFISFALDLSLLEGSLSGSRLIGFYLLDPYNTFQLLSISVRTEYLPYLTMNFIIGFFTIVVFYSMFGGRSFCSWLCPYHFLAEWAEKLHDYLVKKKKVKEHTFQRSMRYIFWVGFIILAFTSERLIFETLNPVGILSRAIIYGPGIILLWVFALIIFEIVYSKRFWCRYVCPIGATWSMVGKITPLAVKFDLDKCGHCRKCQDVCLVPHELWFVTRGKATKEKHYVGSDCTRCGLCIDVCPGDALNYSVKGLDKIL